ncbi:MAG: VPLPA-CTERM sorting domain-containing protein [Pseudomonadota bacterium]
MILKVLASAAVILGISLAGNAQAVSMTSLLADPSNAVTAGDVTFDAFAYADVGGANAQTAAPASALDVTASVDMDMVSLVFTFSSPITATGFDTDFEFNGSFSVGIGNGGTLDDVSFELTTASTTGSGLIEIGSANFGGSAAVVEGGSPAPQSFSQSLGSVSDLSLAFDVTGVPDGGSASITAFTLKFNTTAGIPEIPLPASLPLLLAGIAGIGLVARRRV